MKKFFKALALVLALTLVFGTIPASAAVNPDKVRKEKTLYVDGTKGKTADGVESKLKARTTYWRLLKIKKAEAKELGVTATSADPEVIKTNDESMGVRAYAIGGSKEKPIVITLNDGKNLYKVNMIAKKSAETVVFGQDFKDTEKPYSINTTYKLSLPRTVNGVKLDTDERRLIIKDADGNEVASDAVECTADATAPRLWTVKFLKAGTYTLVGEAYQSNKYNGATATTELTITVEIPELIDVQQTSLNGFQLTFNGDASAIDFTPEEIYYKVADQVVPFSVLSTKAIDEEDPSKVNVTMFGNFKGGVEYFVKVGDVIKSFVASGTAATDIKEFVLKTTEVAFGDFRDIKYAFLNEKGIDITAANPTIVPTFELISNNPSEVVVAGTTIYFYDKDKVAEVKGTVTTDYGNEANGYTPTVFEVTGRIISTDQAKAEFTEVVYSFESKKDYTTANAGDLKSKHEFAIGDDGNGVVLNIFFKYLKADKSGYEYKTMKDEGITNIKVADEYFLVVTNIAGAATVNSYVNVTGIKKGSAQVLLYKTDGNGNEVAIQALPVSVNDKRAVDKIVLAADKNTLNTNYAADEVKLTLTISDQYGDPIDAAVLYAQSKPTAEAVGTFTSTPTFTKVDAGKYETVLKSNAFQFVTGKDDKVGGSIVVSAQVNDSRYSNNIGITVANKDGATIAKIPTVDTDKLDTSVAKKDTKKAVATFGVDITEGGFNAGKYNKLVFVGKSNFDNKVAVTGATEKEYAFTLSLNGVMLEETDFAKSNIAIATTGASITAVSGGAVDVKLNKAKAGTYVFTIYEIGEIASGKTTYTNKGSRTVVVSDAQLQPTVDKKGDTTDATSAANWADKAKIVDDTLTVKYNGTTVTAATVTEGLQIVDADIVQSSDTSYVIKGVTVRLTNSEIPGYIDLPVTVGVLINGSKK